jgi:uncharacterized protein YuzE
MKLSIDNQVDALYITFNDNKVAETMQLELEINADIDTNNRVVGLEVLGYSKLRQWADDLLKENDLSLMRIVLYFLCIRVAWFEIRDVKEEYTVCKTYIEEETIEYDLVQNFIQDEVDFIIRNRNIVNLKIH